MSCAHLYHSGITVVGTTEDSMICFEAYSSYKKKSISVTVNFTQKLMVKDVLDPRGKLTVIGTKFNIVPIFFLNNSLST